MRLVGYVRVSRVGGREGDAFISPSVQREQIAALALARDHEVVEWVEDLDESGGKWERPGFQRVLEMVERGEVDGIAVAKLDRFARSLADALRAFERISAAEGELISVAESVDTTTPAGRLVLQILLAFAEFGRESQAEGFRVAKTHAIESGVHISTTVPLGYLRGEDRRLVLDPETAPTVRELFLRRAAGASWTALARFLDERLPREGAWPRQTVTKMLQNRTYLGEAHQGAISKAGAHPALVSRAEFEAAQPRTGEPARRSGTLLAGVLTCGTCGHPVGRSSSGYYGCRARRSEGICSRPVQIRIARADAEVERVFLEWASKQDVAFAASRRAGDVDEALAQLEAAEAELVAYRDTNLVSVIGQASYVAGLTERAAVADEAQLRLRAAQTANAVPLAHYDVASLWPSLTAAERRLLISSVLEAVVIEPSGSNTRLPVGDRLRFMWRGDASKGEPGLPRAENS